MDDNRVLLRDMSQLGAEIIQVMSLICFSTSHCLLCESCSRDKQVELITVCGFSRD